MNQGKKQLGRVVREGRERRKREGKGRERETKREEVYRQVCLSLL